MADPKKDSASEPEWFALIPEDQRQAAREGWLRQQDYTRKTQELAEQRRQFEEASKAAEEAAKQYGSPEEWARFWQQIQPHWDTFVKWNQAQQSGATSPAKTPTQTTASSPGDDFWTNWDILQPQEQAQRLSQIVAQNVLNQINQQYVPQIQKQFQDYDQYQKNYMTMWRRAFEQKLQDPNIDLDRIFQTAVDMQTGKLDPLDAARQLSVTPEESQQKFEKTLEERLAQERAKWEEEQQAKAKTIPLAGGIGPAAFQPVEDAPKTAQEAKERALNAVVDKYGTGIL
ncbi:MAG: hypothetical protein ACE5H7_13980 [Acidiferrobacterales bacterium]